jgi:hypothetical protein
MLLVDFNKYTQLTLEKSSIKVTKYLKPSREVKKGLQTSECIILNV